MGAARLIVAIDNQQGSRTRRRKKFKHENFAKLIRLEVTRLFRNIGMDQVVHIAFVRKEVKMILNSMGYGFDDACFRNCLMTKDSPFAQCQNMIWVMEGGMPITFWGKKKKLLHRRKRR